ncbi:MAG: transcriptional regulator [Tardiphaga sp.]|jgi:transcriptional regulator with XRE-family HTH domain|nr:transcriptional regulator [Tardiphaga sp.]
MPAARFTPKHDLLANLLREARRAKNLTQQDLARRLGRSQSVIAKIERQERRLDVVEFVELMDAIGTSPESIIRKLRLEK